MQSTLREELRQNKPFHSSEQEALLSIVRTSAVLMDDFEQMLRPYGITATQYNVLRILRGSPDGLSRNDLRDRMLTRMPDVTRLLERMKQAGLVERAKESDDRRLVWTRITKAGSRLLAELDSIVTADETRRFAGIPKEHIRSLVTVLATLRQTVRHARSV